MPSQPQKSAWAEAKGLKRRMRPKARVDRPNIVKLRDVGEEVEADGRGEADEGEKDAEENCACVLIRSDGTQLLICR